ncbi:MAG: hypothetical protein WBO24_01800 [Nitrospirales bacterium]
MRNERSRKDRTGQRERWKILIMVLTLMLAVPGAPIPAKGDGFEVICNIFTLGSSECNNVGHKLLPPNPSAAPTVPVNCSKPVMTVAPRFLNDPKGAAKYPFSANCNSPARPGIMKITWEGSWTPSETRRDRPNASETLTITGYEPFIPGRDPGGKIIMYWTASCTEDPWLQGGTCRRFGGYVPDDLREAFPNIDRQSFPRTAKSLSTSLRQQLVKNYQRANSPASLSVKNRNENIQAMKIPPKQSEAMNTQRRQTQAMTIQPQTIPQRPGLIEQPRTNLRLFSRGTDAPEQAQSESQDPQDSSPEVTSSSLEFEGTPSDNEPVFPQVAITVDQPLHFISGNGEDTLIAAGVYEIEPVLDLQLSLAREGQSTVLLPAIPGTHREAIQQPMALVIPGPSNDEQHLVLLTPDGKRLDAIGSTSGVKSHSPGMVATLPDTILKDAIIQTSEQPASEAHPPCQRNPVPTGPRWLPVPCALSSTPETPGIPVP